MDKLVSLQETIETPAIRDQVGAETKERSQLVSGLKRLAAVHDERHHGCP